MVPQYRYSYEFLFLPIPILYSYLDPYGFRYIPSILMAILSNLPTCGPSAQTNRWTDRLTDCCSFVPIVFVVVTACWSRSGCCVAGLDWIDCLCRCHEVDPGWIFRVHLH